MIPLEKGKDGSESFFRVKQAAELLDKYQVDYNMYTVVTHRCRAYKEIYPFYKNADGFISNILPAWSRLGKNGNKPVLSFSKTVRKLSFKFV